MRGLAAGGSVGPAAAAAGVSERTAYRRLADPGFRQRLAALRDELISAALGELTNSASDAVATLRRLLQAGDERVRLAAARAILEQTLRLREAVSVEQRLSALERRLIHQRRGPARG
jgi:hypothetical protein